VLLRARIGACLAKKALHDREVAYRKSILREKNRADALLNVVIPLGVALQSERVYDRLLERTVGDVRDFCQADGGALWLREDSLLRLVYRECESLALVEREVADSRPLRIDIDSHNPLARAVLDGRSQHVAELDLVSRSVSEPLRGLDIAHPGYQTRSILAVPLPSGDGRIVGVLHLWNARDLVEGTLSGFDDGLVQLVASASTLAGAALDGYARVRGLEQRIQRLEIQIDERKKQEDVAEITETEYFRDLRRRARSLRGRADG
jgi:hypothetical protein